MKERKVSNPVLTKARETIKFLKIRDVKDPERGNPTDAGIDFFVPTFNKSFVEDVTKKNPHLFTGNTRDECCNGICVDTSNVTISGSLYFQSSTIDVKDIFKFNPHKGKNYIILTPHQRILIPSGIKVRMNSDYRALIAANKGGVSSKFGLIFSSQVIDYEYQGEIHIGVINTSEEDVYIYEDMKLMQYLETPIYVSPIEVDDISLVKDTAAQVRHTEEFYEGHKSERKENAFGSTNKIEG